MMENVRTNFVRTINNSTDLINLYNTYLSSSSIENNIYYEFNEKYSLMYYNDIIFRAEISKLLNINK